MSASWRIPINFEMWMQQIDKRMLRQERRPSVSNASQLLGPGAGPYAVLINDWNDEAATFTGVFYSEPGAVNAPDTAASPLGTPSEKYWMGETFGAEDMHGFQRLTEFRVDPVSASGSWVVYCRRFFPQGDLYGYGAWEAI